MRESGSILSRIDWLSVLIYFLLIFMGWISIYAAVYNEEHQSILDTSQKYGKQLIWMGTSVVLIIVILFMDGRIFEKLAYPIYITTVLMLILVLVAGKEVSGAKSWFAIGGFSLQPSEFAKFGTALALSRYLSGINVNFAKRRKDQVISFVLILLPALFIALQPDMGSVLVFAAFVLVLYREGLSAYLIIGGLWMAVLFVLSLLFGKIYVSIGIGVLGLAAFLLFRKNKPIPLISVVTSVLSAGFVFGVDFIFHNLLAPHQQSRFNILLGIEKDLSSAGYNTHQSLIAIGSGGISGKGFLNGTQTKFDFVPEQSTDYIFLHGRREEWGFVGTFIVVVLFLTLITRLIILAERQKSSFSRIYGYSVAAILFVHFTVNIGMTIGLLPVIGIPLPFFSYGGSSLWGFTILLFIFLKLDAYQWQLW